MTVPVTVRIQAEDFDPAAEIARICRAGRTDIGAVVTLHGPVPRRGRHARRAGARALSRHGRGGDRAHRRGGRAALAAAGRHRRSTATGASRRASNIVLVVTASSHRAAAFEAAEFLMDYPEDPRAVLEEGAPRRRLARRLGRSQGRRRRRRRSLDPLSALAFRSTRRLGRRSLGTAPEPPRLIRSSEGPETAMLAAPSWKAA